eukprot:CAMPEP_0174854098 /NCGR_PEP_ID=MMETSP1114-20130205/29970_1 /TAXON_ID=312471 /ORGANISM="Neobodo designis, Strain CCAP 1951/1" /LENGTH=287 /DNA_ID=CAMNT_0016088771 /DNA_START=43 /DNA_END=906 /DNA_ORIENTATION=+
MADWEAQYEKDLATITHSGPHEVGAEQQALNRQVFEMLKPTEILPFDDIHKISDCDLIYRFLIAQRWDADKTAAELIEYMRWRKENNMNDILWEKHPDEIVEVLPFYQGIDNDGNPIFYDRPSPAKIGELLKTYDRAQIIRGHFVMMEQGRRLCKAMNRDRVTCLFDMAMLNMSIVTNPSAVGLLKECSKLDQKYYPENMRTMMITNSGWTFGSLITCIKPLLDVRVQKKIQKLGTGANLHKDMAQFADPQQVPECFGGLAPRTPSEVAIKVLDVSGLPPRTPPQPV